MGVGENRSFFATGKPSLPVSNSNSNLNEGGIRRRLSSLSLKIQASTAAGGGASYWSFPRSKSLSSMGDYAGTSIRKWWDWTWAWILSRKPIFAVDLEMNHQETKLLGSHNKGTLRHVIYKMRSEIRKFVASSDHATLPQTYSSSIPSYNA
ncbi:hypothetical protein PHAVU_008G292700 [Phaseolus vulgaris]|uniref:Uncharacterized protein n=1 Tax=Phaseolus vulgaris TaxID=3885 RepID=V7BCG6_PHAVU|nr:hypothetical protein PHAVU_008G292700g [Phaseolus vulgaris]ESW14573.1 hypothetical protein PHAVU_008G292700g [Phaseolus vulgaris]